MDGPTEVELAAIRAATFTVEAVDERGRVREHVDCVGRTHGVHAEPRTFGVGYGARVSQRVLLALVSSGMARDDAAQIVGRLG